MMPKKVFIIILTTLILCFSQDYSRLGSFAIIAYVAEILSPDVFVKYNYHSKSRALTLTWPYHLTLGSRENFSDGFNQSIFISPTYDVSPAVWGLFIGSKTIIVLNDFAGLPIEAGVGYKYDSFSFFLGSGLFFGEADSDHAFGISVPIRWVNNIKDKAKNELLIGVDFVFYINFFSNR